MEYIFSISEPVNRFISIELKIDGPFPAAGFDLQLPSWRPGRYELGNFAKNVKGFSVTDVDENPVQFSKVSKDSWHILPKSKHVTVRYQYYANQPDAGACYLDHDLLYVNPVHCCFFIPGREKETCKVVLKVPADWKIASGMEQTGSHTLEASGFDQLADCPFMSSPNFSHAHYTLEGITFNIWIKGDANPDWPRIIRDFDAFTSVQLNMMKEFPAKDYHFLVLLLPFPFYHGVEHLNSTVLALGPGYKLMEDSMYKEFLGVASHELFHSWNVKTIRPAEMLPYDFTKENYAHTGYVYEGVTTYYGDLFLARSGFFSLKDLLREYSIRLQKHMDNPGRFNYSVAESSFDTWLDGYVPGVPGRKTSIYDEGCLLALILDFMIRSATDSKKSLDDVMCALYFDFAKKNRGYTGDDFREVAESVAGRSFKDFFDTFIYKAASLDSLLMEIVSLAGIQLSVMPALTTQERWWGIRTEVRNGQLFVNSVCPGSPSAYAGLNKDDELISFNNTRVENNLGDLITAFDQTTSKLLISSGRKIREVEIKRNGREYFNRYILIAEEQCTHAQLLFRQRWLSH